MSGAEQTLTMRIETAIDRWNKLPGHEARALISPDVTAVSIHLGELARMKRELLAEVESLEKKLDAYSPGAVSSR